jgi:hypothetical protein
MLFIYTEAITNFAQTIVIAINDTFGLPGVLCVCHAVLALYVQTLNIILARNKSIGELSKTRGLSP